MWRFVGLVGSSGELPDQATGDTGRQEGVAGGEDPDGGEKFFGGGVFEQEPAAPARRAA